MARSSPETAWEKAKPLHAREQAAAGERPSDAEVAARLGMGSGELVGALLHAGEAAQALLLSANTLLVHKVAHQFRGTGVPHEDLVQVRPPAGMCLCRMLAPWLRYLPVRHGTQPLDARWA